MKKIEKALGASLLALLCGSGGAQVSAPAIADGAYRPGMPDVIGRAAPAQLPGFNVAAFSAAYASAGKPAVAVLWNRQLSDVLEQGSSSALTIDSAAIGAAQVDGGSIIGASERRTTLTAQDSKSRQPERAQPAEHRDLQMRSAFMQAMVRAGVHLVDRNVVMRTRAAAQKGQPHDEQQIETEALAQHAKLLMEVLNTPDPDSPTGWATYVSVKRIADGVLMAEGYIDGKAAPVPPPPKRFVADPNGGFKEAHAEKVVPSMSDAGKRAAEMAMQNLQQALARP